MPQNDKLNNPAAVALFLPDTSSAPSLFQGHQLRPQNVKPEIHLTRYDYATGFVLFLCVAAFVWLYAANAKRLGQLIKGFYSNRSNNQLSRDEYSVTNRVGLLLSVLFLITISIFIVQAADYSGIRLVISRASMYAYIASGLALIYLIKAAFIRAAGNIFKVSKEAGEYSSTMLMFLNALGLFMLPVVICLAFVKQIDPRVFIYFGYFMIAGFLCVRLIRGLVIGFRSSRVSKFYLFMYLCTLEIIPFIILAKLFKIYIK